MRIVSGTPWPTVIPTGMPTAIKVNIQPDYFEATFVNH